MKKTLFVALCVVSVSVSVFAQKQITVLEDTFAMSKGTQTGFQVVVPQITLIEAEKQWLKYVATGTKVKATAVNGENIQPGAVNPNVSPKPFTIYSKLLETTEGVRITAWLTENDTIFFSKQVNSDQDLAVQKYIRDFAVAVYHNEVKDELQAEQDKQKALEKELNNLIKEEEKSGKKISESNRAIQKSTDNIATNNGDIQNMAYKISDQKGMVERTASDPNAHKGAKQTLKDLENQRKKLQSQNVAENKNIDAMNKTIREEERKITDLKEREASKTTEIEQQKQKVKEVLTKLEGIR